MRTSQFIDELYCCLEENENMGLNYFAKLKKSTMYYHFSIMCHDRRAF